MKKTFKIIIALCFISALLFLSSCNSAQNDYVQELNFAIPYEEGIKHLQDSYYIKWLEAQCDVKINLSFISQDHTSQYLNSMLTYAQSDIDGILFSKNSALDSADIQQYTHNGNVLPLNDLIEENSVYLKQALANYLPYNLENALKHDGENIYYMPALSGSLPKQYTQTMWINIKWLEESGLALPSTTEEFEQVLSVFRRNYMYALPIMGTAQNDALFPINFIMNSFEICDAQSSYFAIENDDVYFAPHTEDFRQGLIYCANLYSENLLSQDMFNFNAQQLISLVNDPRLLVGMFSSFNISDVLSENSSELYSYYLPLAPLKHEDNNANSILYMDYPSPGGIILASSDNAQKAFEVLDLMCSEQAYLIGHFGEPGVDWAEAEVGEISASGLPALISVSNTQTLQRDISFSNVIGPYITIDKFAQAVAWKGYQVNQNEYMQARAFRTYEDYEVAQSLSPLLFERNKDNYANTMLLIKEHTINQMIAFITGTKDITNDEHWQEYIDSFEHIDQMEFVIQQLYDKANNN